MSSLRSLGKDLFTYGVMGGISRSVHLLLMPILTRHFSSAEYGSIDAIATLTSFLALVMALTLESAVARLWFDSVREHSQKKLVSTTLAFIFVFGTCLSVLICYQTVRISWFLHNDLVLPSYIVLATVSAVLTALAGIPQIVLRMERRIAAYNLLVTLQTFSYVSISLLLIYQTDAGLLGIFAAMAFSNGLTLAAGLLLVSSCLGFEFSLATLKASLRYCIPMFPGVAVSWLSPQIDRIVLLTVLGLGTVGVYGAAAKIALIMGIVITAFQQAWSPLAIAAIDHSIDRSNFYRRVLNYYAGAMAIIGLVLATFSKEILAVLAPPEYQAGYMVIPWLIGAQILYGSGCITNIGTLISKKTFHNSVSAWSAAAFNIGCTFILVPLAGIRGAAIGSFLGGLIFTTLLSRFSTRVTGIVFENRVLLTILGLYILAGIWITVISELRYPPMHSIILRVSLLILTLFCIGYVTVRDSSLTDIICAIRRGGKK